jgi:hypothetical protein
MCDLQLHNIVCIRGATDLDPVTCKLINLGHCCEDGEMTDTSKLNDTCAPPELVRLLQQVSDTKYKTLYDLQYNLQISYQASQ